MEADNNNKWLSFSLMSSMEMPPPPPTAAAAADTHHFYSFADNFYAANGWATQKAAEAMYGETEHHHQLKDHDDSSSVFTAYMQPPPKLEDFFAAGGDSTETQDSSLTHIYDPHQHHHTAAAAYYSNADHHQDLKNFTGFQAFSANSGSEVDDSAFQTQSPVESAGEFVAYSNFTANNTAHHNNSSLSLGVQSSNKNESNKNSAAIVAVDSAASSKKVADTFGQRTSIYRGVTRHRWTGRYEAHLWDNSCRREGQARKGRQVYLGGYDKEDKAARAYDLAALKYWGPTATTNFPISNYTKELEEMKHATKQEFIASLRRKSSGFSRGASIYRGVTRHHQQGRWQARIGRVAGNKDLYLGTFATEEEAAEAYDIAAIKFRGLNAVTNFEMNRYDVEAIAKSPLPIGGTAKRLKLSLEAAEEKLPPSFGGGTTATGLQSNGVGSSSNISFSGAGPTIPYGVPYDTNAAPFYHHSLFQHLNPGGGSDGTHIPSVNQTNLMMTSSQPEFFIWPHHQSYN